MLKRNIITTQEGTKTIQIEEWNECYHSHHGILQEAKHVFINNGLELINLSEINILEIGFGTGLNAILTVKRAIERQIKINYYTIEKYPIIEQEIKELEYWTFLEDEKLKNNYFLLHESEWEKEVEINSLFTITKYRKDFFELEDIALLPIDLVYYDAFGARVQPDLWEEPIFKQVYNKMSLGALLTTYSSKGTARKAMQIVGFTVEKKEGPKGKREMVNAWKK